MEVEWRQYIYEQHTCDKKKYYPHRHCRRCHVYSLLTSAAAAAAAAQNTHRKQRWRNVCKYYSYSVSGSSTNKNELVLTVNWFTVLVGLFYIYSDVVDIVYIYICMYIT